MNASHASHARSSEEVDMRLLRFRRGTESVTANAAPAVLVAMLLGPVELSKHGLIARPNLRRYTVAGRLSVFNCFFAVHSTLDYCTAYVPAGRGRCLLVFSSRFILRSFLLPGSQKSALPYGVFRSLPTSATIDR